MNELTKLKIPTAQRKAEQNNITLEAHQKLRMISVITSTNPLHYSRYQLIQIFSD
jgi:hypothetical protein